jgi:mycoredoxin
MIRRHAKKLGAETGMKSQIRRDRAVGAAHQLARTEADEWPENDAVLVDKIRSEVLGGPEWSPYTINVDAARGVVALRGQVDRPEQVDELEERVRNVPGVREVHSYLHLPGNEPPNVEEALFAVPSWTGMTRRGRQQSVAAITIYWRPMCGYCERLKRALADRGVAYQGVDIWADRSEAAVVRAATGGDEVVPTVRVGDRFLVNPSVEEVLEAAAAA